MFKHQLKIIFALIFVTNHGHVMGGERPKAWPTHVTPIVTCDSTDAICISIELNQVDKPPIPRASPQLILFKSKHVSGPAECHISEIFDETTGRCQCSNSNGWVRKSDFGICVLKQANRIVDRESRLAAYCERRGGIWANNSCQQNVAAGRLEREPHPENVKSFEGMLAHR